MHLQAALTILAATCHLASAAPAANDVKVDKHLRLIKTSPEDAGIWVTQDQIDKLAVASHRTSFIDITDIEDKDVLSVLSTPEESISTIAARQVQYPTSLSHTTEANRLIASVSNSNPQTWLTTLTNFNNRHYRSSTGTQASTWVFNTATTIASANPSITVRRVTHSAFNQPSVIVRIPGQTSSLVIVGAHFDSTAGSTTARSPGADDNGTGTVNALEALRVLANARFAPKNTLEFHFYAGEEGGLLGSADIFRQYRSQGASVLAFLNTDMSGYSPGGRVVIYQDNVDASLTSYVTLIAQQYAGTTTTSRCGYGCSDHASARSNGFRKWLSRELIIERSVVDILI
jgi:leucyl aminopeptidase